MSIKGQMNYIILPLLVLTAALLMLTFSKEAVHLQEGMEEAHLRMIQERGFGYNGSVGEMLNRLCSGGSFSTYVVELRVENNTACWGEECEELRCNATEVECHHCIIAVEGGESLLRIEVVE